METQSLDDVMLKMWQQFASRNWLYPGTVAVSHRVGSWNKLDDFFKQYVDGIEELHLTSTWNLWHLVDGFEEEQVPHLGMKVTTENGRELIKFVRGGYACRLGN